MPWAAWQDWQQLSTDWILAGGAQQSRYMYAEQPFRHSSAELAADMMRERNAYTAILITLHGSGKAAKKSRQCGFKP